MKKQKSISKIFAFYIIIFCIFTSFLMYSFFYYFYIILDNAGILLPANYYETQIEKHRNEISQGKYEDLKALIPKECDYAVYDLEGNMLQGNISEEKSKNMWNLVVQNRENSLGRRFYKAIERNGEVCIVEYTLISKFANPTINKYIPNAEFLPFLICLILFITEIVVFSKCFQRKMTKEMKILKDATKNIQMQNLDFKTEHSKVIEINEVLLALDKMKTELHESLKKQWKMEEVRKEQIAALAHDIKTPLTIIRGNSELLNELDLKSDQKEFNDGILNAVGNIELYTKSLMEIIKSEKETVIQKKQIDLEKFMQDVIEQSQSMSINKNLKFISEIKRTPKFILADEMALKRAIINVISNSVDYCDVNGKILFSADMIGENLRFIIEDSGRGFSPEELQFATVQFFQGDKSRNSKNHYGMGLYIVREFMKQHNGSIQLKNSEKLGGAKVILEVPVIS